MTKLYRLLTALATAGAMVVRLHAQNLVPNSSFEEYSPCPDSLSGVQVANAIGWMSYSRTPDYLNGCQGASCHLCVPDNTFAWQHPAHGQAYMGLYCYWDQEPYREMIGVQLLEPLVPGVRYYGSFKVNCAAEKPEQSTDIYATNKIGLLLTNFESGLPDDFNEVFETRNYAQVFAEEILGDTAAWVLVSGSFVSDSAYQYVVIGNHYDDDHTAVMQLIPDASGGSYYFVDEVCLSPNPLGCPLANNVADVGRPVLALRPNPASNELVLHDSIGSAVRITDAAGRLVFEAARMDIGSIVVDVSEWSAGLYMVVVLDEWVVRSMRFTVVH